MANTDRVLTVLRHAKSAWPEGVPDRERPLAERGRADAPAAGKWLREREPFFELVLCSPAIRARQTWELVAGELTEVPFVRYEERLYDATAGGLLAVTHDLSDAARSVLLIGHNPGLSDLVTGLTGTPHELKTASIAVLRWSGEWLDAAPGTAQLLASARPRG